MATQGYQQPFYIIERGGSIEITAKVEGTNMAAWECADMATAVELALFMNLAWQVISFGGPDPALWSEFNRRGFGKIYGQSDLFEIFDLFADLGLMASTFN